MEANPVRIVQYFDGEKQSIIPLFQRPYTWEKRNWGTIWNDIMAYYDSDDDSTHFMGAIVSIPARTVPVGVTKHLIIDGQQRLTTIAIVLCALRDENEKIAAQIQDYLVNRHYENNPDYLKLLPTQGDRDVYCQLVNQKIDNKTKHLMLEAYDYFRNAINQKDDNDESLDPVKLFDIVKRCLQVVMINLGEADDPYLIFESLNYKGEPLSQADLVRNFILMKFKHSLAPGGEQEKVYNDLWHPLEELLKDNLGEFLWHYASQNGTNVKKPRIYATIKAKFADLKSSEACIEEISEMRRHGGYYHHFLFPSEEPNHDIKMKLTALSKMEVSISYPLLLKLFRGYDKGAYGEMALAKCLSIIESMILRRTIVDEKRAALNKVFVILSSRFAYEANPDEWLQSDLLRRVRSERWPDDDELLFAFVNKEMYGTKGIKLVLEGIETLCANKELIDFSNVNLSIEHIMPQTLTDEWKTMLGSNWAEIHKKYLHTSGNLTLTAYNPELSNLPFDKKKEIFINSGLALNRLIAQEPVWGPEQIENRSKYLAKKTISIWKRPKNSPSLG